LLPLCPWQLAAALGSRKSPSAGAACSPRRRKITEAQQAARIKAWLTQDGKACPRLDRGIANMRERLASVSEADPEKGACPGLSTTFLKICVSCVLIGQQFRLAFLILR
jgi:hypothetical protein